MPFGAMHLITIPMGWTNSVPIFHNDVTFILQPEIPDTTIPFIDNIPICGPVTRYIANDSSFETLSQNDGIHCFVWEYFQGLNRVVQRMKYCHGTFSGYKATLYPPEMTVVRHWCTYEGYLPKTARVDKVTNWGPCLDVSDVRAFLGTIGVCCMFIRNFVHHVNPLTILTHKIDPSSSGQNKSLHKKT